MGTTGGGVSVARVVTSVLVAFIWIVGGAAINPPSGSDTHQWIQLGYFVCVGIGMGIAQHRELS